MRTSVFVVAVVVALEVMTTGHMQVKPEEVRIFWTSTCVFLTMASARGLFVFLGVS